MFTSTVRALRLFSTEATVARFHEFGQPSRVLKVEKVALPATLEANQVKIKFIAAPINPADINTIEGTYGIVPSAFPAVAGHEGVAVVEAVGSGVSSLKVGDRVIPAAPGFGTWRSHAVCKAEELQTVASDIPVEYAATLAVNPCAAYRLLADFVTLKAGDVIVQNGADTAVGQAVVQIAKARGIKTINIIRDGPNTAEMMDRLKSLGGDIVVDASYAAHSAQFAKLVADLPKPKLGLNCVGGDVARDTLRLLADGGVFVTYGGLSKKPLTIGTSSLIFKDITLRGFWLSKWLTQATPAQRNAMFEDLYTLIREKKLKSFVERKSFAEMAEAVALAQSADRTRKIVVTF